MKICERKGLKEPLLRSWSQSCRYESITLQGSSRTGNSALVSSTISTNRIPGIATLAQAQHRSIDLCFCCGVVHAHDQAQGRDSLAESHDDLDISIGADARSRSLSLSLPLSRYVILVFSIISFFFTSLRYNETVRDIFPPIAQPIWIYDHSIAIRFICISNYSYYKTTHIIHLKAGTFF